MIRIDKEVPTEMGTIFIEAAYDNEKEAKKDGYTYAFVSTSIDCTLWSKIIDKSRRTHHYAVVG
ncbi:hypothetical protein [Butyrivibrio proteoclasticus]|uniref:hypothetical protein n=1 Tax=Butyrivibrio proteoclasticus TaxID=43305 RepID=UPI00047EBA7D|nr:hypothetical protein [Butyrivibrio proteoclasticus]